jgi:hypothetical protein
MRLSRRNRRGAVGEMGELRNPPFDARGQLLKRIVVKQFEKPFLDLLVDRAGSHPVVYDRNTPGEVDTAFDIRTSPQSESPQHDLNRKHHAGDAAQKDDNGQHAFQPVG